MLTVPVLLHKMHIQAIDDSSVMIKAKILENTEATWLSSSKQQTINLTVFVGLMISF